MGSNLFLNSTDRSHLRLYVEDPVTEELSAVLEAGPWFEPSLWALGLCVPFLAIILAVAIGRITSGRAPPDPGRRTNNVVPFPMRARRRGLAYDERSQNSPSRAAANR